ncbi:MAG: DUF6471 domain-containing protein [Rhizomicrobium sp.]
MVTDEAWQAKARAILKRELAGDGIKRRDLVERLAKIDVQETEQNIANKLSRGSFSAVFMLQVLEAIGKKITITDI